MADSIVGNSPLSSGVTGQYEIVPLYVYIDKTEYDGQVNTQIETVLSIPLQQPNAKFAKVTLSQFVLYNSGNWITTVDPSYKDHEECLYISPTNSPFIVPKIDIIDNDLITANVCKYSTHTGAGPFSTQYYVYMSIFNNNFIIRMRAYTSPVVSYLKKQLKITGIAEIYY